MYKRLPTSLAVVSFGIVVLTYVVNAMDRLVFPVLLPGIASEFNFPLATGGLLATLFTLGLGIAGVPGSFLFARFQRKYVAIGGVLIYSLCTILTCHSRGFLDMAVYRVVSGIGEALQNVAVFTIAGSYFYRHRSAAIGTLVFAYGAGSFLGPKLGAELLLHSQSWRAPLYAYGIVGLIGALVVLFLVSPRLTEQHTRPHEDRVDEAHIPNQLLNRNTCLLAFTAVCAGIAAYAYVGLYPTYLIKELHFPIATTGTVASMFGVGALFALLGGVVADRFNQKVLCLLSLAAMIFSGYGMFNIATTPLTQGAMSFIEGVAFPGFLYVNLYSLIQRSVRFTQTGRASGLMVTCLYLPSAASGFLFATLRTTFGWGNAALYVLCLPLIIAFVAMLFFDISQTSCPSALRKTARTPTLSEQSPKSASM
ncbi:MFS transporter [Burkholderia orbicola]|uniref:MFS transporter n=1 Tax=Burkholderia orbicola TaxID=2978683 RepID=UPI0035C6DC47